MICTVERTVAKRRCACQVCGEPILHGEERYTYSTPTQKERHAHIGCYFSMCEDGYTKTHTLDNNEPTLATKPHTIIVVAPKEDVGYFGQYLFSSLPYSPTHRKYVSPIFLNRHSSGHIVPIALENGYKVYVDGEQISSFEQFRRLTDNM